jgi:hypothetical protein
MLCFIFGILIFTLIYIINIKTSAVTIDPFIVDINDKTILGKILSNAFFKKGSNVLFGY